MDEQTGLPLDSKDPLGLNQVDEDPKPKEDPQPNPNAKPSAPKEDQEILREGQGNRRGQVQEKTHPHPNDSRSLPHWEGIHAQSHLFSPNSLLDSDPAEPQPPLQHGLLRNRPRPYPQNLVLHRHHHQWHRTDGHVGPFHLPGPQ